jgi:hypothetical protein
MTGIGGDFEARIATGKMRWQGRLICDHFVVIENLPLILLGRAEFFAKYEVTFLWSESPPCFDVDAVA